MERSNEFNNQTMQIEKYIICINDEIEVNQVREEIKNPSLQIEVSRVSREFDEKKLNKFCNNCKFKEKNGILIIEMHFVGLFIV
jgi:hypothetical protein